MNSSPDSMTYVRLTRIGNGLNGYVQVIRADSKNDEGFSTLRSHITGEVTGSSFSLHADSGDNSLWGGIKGCEGTISSGKLSITYPATTGGVDSIVLSPATSDAWNSKINLFEEKQRIAAYRRLWSHTLGWWPDSRRKELAYEKDYRDKVNDYLPKQKEEAEHLREQEKIIKVERAKVDAALKDVNEKRNALEAVLKDPKSDSADIDTTLVAFKKSLSAATKGAGDSADACDVNGIKNSFQYLQSSYNSIANNLSSLSNMINSVIRDKEKNPELAESNRNNALRELKSAKEGLGNIPERFKDLDNSIKYNLEGIKRYDDAVQRYKDSELRTKEIANELKYFTSDATSDLLKQFDKGFPVGTAVTDTVIRLYPDKDAHIVYNVEKGTKIPALNSGREWHPVFFPGQIICWVESKTVKVEYTNLPEITFRKIQLDSDKVIQSSTTY